MREETTQDYLIDVAREASPPPPPPRTYWKPDPYCASVREISEKRRREDEKWAARYKREPPIFFDTKQEAVDWKIQQIEKEIARYENEARKSKQRLAAFQKKFGFTNSAEQQTVQTSAPISGSK